MSHYIWYEKHRPNNLDKVVLPDEYRSRFEQYIEDGNFPHLLFVGPPGSGKTTMAKILIGSVPCQAIELNASSRDRGIDTIRGKVTDFARSMPLPGKLKVVFFDEADKLSPDAQTALRNTIEATAETCRFIFTANFGDKMISPLKSRCTIFTFEVFPKRLVYRNIVDILNQEEVVFQKSDIIRLIERYYPDIRSIVNNIQSGSMEGSFNPALANLTGSADTEQLLTFFSEGEIRKMRELWAGTSDFSWLYRWLFNEVVPVQFLDEEIAVAALTVAQYMYQDSTVLDREINFTACCIELMKGPLGITKIKW